MKLVFLGPPGAGKGTQAECLCERMNFVHISTGDMLRHEIEQKTEIGLMAESIISKGEFVSDDIVVKMVLNKIDSDNTAKGFLLDGFPRTLNQAKLLSESMKVDMVLNIDVPVEKLLDRILSRRSCSVCGGVFNINELNQDAKNKCPTCGGLLTVRKDDSPEVFKERYRLYAERTMPIIDFFEAKGCLVHIDGNKPKEQVANDIFNAVSSLGNC